MENKKQKLYQKERSNYLNYCNAHANNKNKINKVFSCIFLLQVKNKNKKPLTLEKTAASAKINSKQRKTWLIRSVW